MRRGRLPVRAGYVGVFIPCYTIGWHMDGPLPGFERVRRLGGYHEFRFGGTGWLKKQH